MWIPLQIESNVEELETPTLLGATERIWEDVFDRAEVVRAAERAVMGRGYSCIHKDQKKVALTKSRCSSL